MIIDRFENEYAVIELDNGTIVDMPKVLLPVDAKEGSVIHITVDAIETKNRENRIQNKTSRLFKNK